MAAVSHTPFIVMVAPNGARKTKADHPALPIGPAELARTAAECVEAGAAAIHVHVRDGEGRHSLDAQAYEAALAAIRAEVGDRLLCQITTEAVGRFTTEEQMAMVRAVRPDWVSLAIRELCPSEGDVGTAAGFFRWMREEAVAPQLILYDQVDQARYADLKARGIIPWENPPVIYVLGRYAAGQTSEPADLLPFLAEGDARDPWMVCAFGPLEAAVAQTACLLGGHARLGFENNLYLATGVIAPSNAALIRQTAGALALTGRRLATADEARERMLV